MRGREFAAETNNLSTQVGRKGIIAWAYRGDFYIGDEQSVADRC